MSAITLAPLPTFRELVLASIRSALPDDTLAKSWLGNGDRAFWFSRSAWSLQAIADWRSHLSCEKTVTVWVPDFFCNSSLSPLRKRGVRLVFYQLTDELTPDLEWCRSHVAEKHPDLFILVHYFGQPIPANPIAQFCKDVGAWLIEDAAHVLRPIPGVGNHGDFVLYSPHKHLAIPDGAILLIRENGPAELGCNAIALPVLNNVTNDILGQSNRSFKHSATWLGKRVLQKLGIRGKNPKLPLWPDVLQENYFLPAPRMSSLAKRLLSIQISSLDDVANLRMQNLDDWKKQLDISKSTIGAFKWSTIITTPYLACIIGEDFKDTESFYNCLQLANVPVLTWPDLPPEVLAEFELHKNAYNLRQKRIYLPVHQTLNHFK